MDEKKPVSFIVDSSGQTLEIVDEKAREDIRGLSAENHPIGSLFLSDIETNPAAIFGGTWEYLSDTHMFQGWYAYKRIA